MFLLRSLSASGKAHGQPITQLPAAALNAIHHSVDGCTLDYLSLVDRREALDIQIRLEIMPSHDAVVGVEGGLVKRSRISSPGCPLFDDLITSKVYYPTA